MHSCNSQCDRCHTLENCVPATRRFDDLILCGDCYREVRSEYMAALAEY